MKYLLLLTLISCSGTKIRQFSGPDGTSHISVTCFEDPDDCYEAAAKRCRSGYEFVNRYQNMSFKSGGATRDERINFLIRCK